MSSQADVATAEHQPSLVASMREQCGACGAALTSDQRYCVECGQRRGPARVPSMDGLAQRAREAPTARRPPRRPRMSVNSTLIAGIGTLLLAMGIGVLIGRSGQGSNARSATPAVQLVTVPGAGAASTSTASAEVPLPEAGATKTTKSSGGAKSASKSASKTPAPAPAKVVTVGSKGKGPGYQKGHFTGNFFGEGEK